MQRWSTKVRTKDDNMIFRRTQQRAPFPDTRMQLVQARIAFKLRLAVRLCGGPLIPSCVTKLWWSPVYTVRLIHFQFNWFVVHTPYSTVCDITFGKMVEVSNVVLIHLWQGWNFYMYFRNTFGITYNWSLVKRRCERARKVFSSLGRECRS